MSKNLIKLPDNQWLWESEWLIENSDETDENGWQYTFDFKSFKNRANAVTFLRRRKWLRSCFKIT